MSLISDTLNAMAIALRTAFRPPVTEPLPWKSEREHPERYRASFALTHDDNGEENCIACKVCEKICPSEIIHLELEERRVSEFTGKKRGYVGPFTLDLNACIVCELCVQVCPTDAIVMVSEPQPPGFSREDLFLTRERLYENEKLAHSWANGTKLVEMQDPNRAPEPPPPEREAGTGAARPGAPTEEGEP